MSDQSASGVIWLTQDAFDKLQNEYDYLCDEGRAIVTAKIAQARDEGDLSENGGYHAAREEQGHQEARIRQLKDMLGRAQVGEAPLSDEVEPGVRVTVAFEGDPDDTDTFLLGSREVLGLDESVTDDVYSPQSPIGAAVLGKKKGEVATYKAPNGREISVTILDVAPFSIS